MLIQTRSQSHHRRLFGGYHKKILGYGPIAYWPLWEPSGSVATCLVNSAQNGSYTGVTLGQTGIGDGNTCPLFDGANDFVDIYSPTLRDAFRGAEGTLIVWAKISGVSVWTDSTYRIMCQLKTDGSNRMLILKDSADSKLRWIYQAGGSTDQYSLSDVSTINWFCAGMTWSVSALPEIVRAYYGGSEVGSSENLGVWAGNLADGLTNIGCDDNTGPSLVWDGYLAHVAVWDYALPAASILDLSTV